MRVRDPAYGVLYPYAMGLEVEERRLPQIPLTQTDGATKGADAVEVRSARRTGRPGEVDEVVAYERLALWDEIHTAAQVYRSPRPACLIAQTVEGKTCSEAANRIEAELGGAHAAVRAIGDRQRALTASKATIEKQTLPAIRELIDAARESIALAESATSPEVRERQFHEAAARLQAAEIMTQLEKIEVSYLAVADYAEDHGFPSQVTVGILSVMNKDLQPVADAALTLDAVKMREALVLHQGALEHAAVFLPEWGKRLERGSETSRKAIAAIDAAVIVLSLYQGARAVGEGLAGGVGGPGIGGISASGAAVSSSVPVTAELAESIRELIRIGALTNAAVSGGPGSPGLVGPLARPTPLATTTPSGIVVPTKGPFQGQEVRYGDSRKKHTAIAQCTLAEILKALKSPKHAKGALRAFVNAVRAGGKPARNFGSQLSKEGVAKYESLVLDALEHGKPAGNGNLIRAADFEIGVDVETGKPTRSYRLDGAPHGAHIIPIRPN